MKIKSGRQLLPATYSGPRPGDFPLGSVESRAAARALLVWQTRDIYQAEIAALGPLNEFEIAFIEGWEGGLKLQMLQIARVWQAANEGFGVTLPTLEELRHDAKVRHLVKELSGGQIDEFHPDWDRYKALAEEQLREGSKKKPPTS